MDLLVTGYSKPTQKFAYIRIVVTNCDPTDGYAVVNRLRNLYIEKAKGAMMNFNVDGNRIITEKADENGDAALRFEVPFQEVNDFINAPFFGGLLKAFSTKVLQCGYTFNPTDIKTQIDVPTQDDLKLANKITDDFIKKTFGTLDDPRTLQFLNSYCGNIKILSVDGKGWDCITYSPRNIAMIYAQFANQNITPTYVASAREWAICYNRRIIDGAQGVVIEVPLDNKRLDKAKYSQLAGRNYDNDIRGNNGGNARFLAMRLGNNQNDPQSIFVPGRVYDITQTEVMSNAQGIQLKDEFNDPQQQRLKNLLDPSQGFVIDTQNSGSTTGNNGAQASNSPLQSHADKIGVGLENIRKGMENAIFQGMFNQIIPQVERAMKNPSSASMSDVIKAIAKMEVYQIDTLNDQKDKYVSIITNLIMAGCGYGDINEVAAYARKVQQERAFNQRVYTKVFSVVRDITKLLNGQLNESIMNENICHNFSFDEFMQILGVRPQSEEQIQENIKEKQEEFKTILNKINEAKI